MLDISGGIRRRVKVKFKFGVIKIIVEGLDEMFNKFVDVKIGFLENKL